MKVTRRDFLRATGAGVLLAGVPAGWAGGAYASDAPETPKVRIGIIALTDCSSIVMAHELGLFKKHGIESTISKEASWAVIRDRLTLGENQATHMLLGMPYASTMGLMGSPVKPMIIPFYLNRNGQAITLTKELRDKGVKTPQQLKPLVMEAKAKGAPMTFAMTYPPGTHAMWIRYWLASGGINPDKDVSLITIPPPQMVANMKVGKMDGYCVGEPWPARDRGRHRVHRHHHPADVEGSSGKSLRVYRRLRRKESENRKSHPEGAAAFECLSGQTRKPETRRRCGGTNDIYQLPAGDHSSAADG